MTQLEALDDLIAAVRAGETSRVHIERMSRKAGLAEAGSVYGGAYQDDLNAARAVHKALLPGWPVTIGKEGTAWTDEKRGLRRLGHKAVVDGKPGRAWLLAALQAYRSTLVAS